MLPSFTQLVLQGAIARAGGAHILHILEPDILFDYPVVHSLVAMVIGTVKFPAGAPAIKLTAT
jgi:hypothetical protein